MSILFVWQSSPRNISELVLNLVGTQVHVLTAPHKSGRGPRHARCVKMALKSSVSDIRNQAWCVTQKSVTKCHSCGGSEKGT